MAKKSASSNNLTASVRTDTGKGASRQARRDGKVPAVLYGHGTDPQHLELDARDFAAVLRHSGTNAVLTLDIEGTEQLALTKALEIHPIRRNIQHADLIVVRRGEKVTVEVNVVIEGEADPRHPGHPGSQHDRDRVRRQSIPEQLTVSVEGAQAGTQFTAGQIELPDGVTLISDPEPLVVNVVAAPTAEDLESEGGGASIDEQAAERRSRRGGRGRGRRGRRGPGRIRRVGGRLTSHGRAAAGGGPGQSRAHLRQDPAQPRLHGRRPAGRSHRLGLQGAQEVRRRGRHRPARRPVGGAGQAPLLHERVGAPGRPAGQVLLGGRPPTWW